MRVVLFRHGPAADRDAVRWPDDDERPLTPRGERRTRAAARGLARLEPALTRIVTSPLMRAARTAGLLAEALDAHDVETDDALRPGGSYRALLQRIAQHRDEPGIVLVGHEPDLGKLAGTLLFGAPAAVPLKKAGACAIELEDEMLPGTGRLTWFLSPKLLRRGVGKKERI